MPKKKVVIKHATILIVYLLVVWGFYRFFIKLPEEVEELIIKPIVWLLPIIYLVNKEGGNLASVGITTKKLFPAIYFTLALGAVFAVEAIIIHFVKYDGFEFAANIGEKVLLISLGISFVTAFSEEVFFRGYLFNRIWSALRNEWVANIITSIMWALIHVPIAIFAWKLSLTSAAIYLFLTALFGVGSAFVFARTRNVFSSILLHILWQWPIILFR
jgi:membrane protease YdiL (CAAX protease family)